MNTQITASLPRERARGTPFARFALLPILLFLANAQPSHGGSATWNSSPKDGSWNNPTNWTQITVPNGPNDIASFHRSLVTNLFISAYIQVSEVVFRPGASSYSIVLSDGVLDITGIGVTNNSIPPQDFGVFGDAFSSKGGTIYFGNNATAGHARYTAGGSVNEVNPGDIEFSNSSNAGDAVFLLQGTFNQTYGQGGLVQFHNDSSAANASFLLDGNLAASYLGSEVNFFDSAVVGDANFTINGGQSVSGANGAAVYAGSLAPEEGNASIIINGGAVSGADGGHMKFQPAVVSDGSWKVTVNGGAVGGALGGTFECDDFDAGDSIYRANGGTGTGAAGGLLSFNNTQGVRGTLIASGGSDGGAGGTIRIASSYSGASPAVEVFRNGTFDVTLWASPSVTSLDGNGVVTLGSQNLSIGEMDASSSFGGSINGTGGVTKIGAGTVTFSGANKYSGQTVVNAGTLLVNNSHGWGTGAGPVSVNAGGIGGAGIIYGAIAVGIGGGTGAFVAPGVNGIARLRTANGVTFKNDATYVCEINSDTGNTDSLAAKGVSIFGASNIVLSDLGSGVLSQGTTLRIIVCTGNEPISGRFGNLPDGSTVTVGSNSYLVNYEGGDGNDLTLTVE